MNSTRLLLPVLLLLSGAAAQARTAAENIFFIKPDGITYLNYSTTRSDYPNYSLFLKKDETDASFDYIYPNEYRFDSKSEAERNVLLFDQGSYATMRPGRLADRVTVDKGVYTFVNWEESKNPKLPGGYYGEWTSPNDFAQYVYVWVLPDNLEIVSFEANQPEEKGTWQLRRNTLAWFGRDVNNIVFKIQYRQKTSRVAELVRTALHANGSSPQDIGVIAEQQDVRVVLPSGILFPSGSPTLSDPGKTVISQIANALKTQESQHFVVEGHTDNSPISAALQNRFSSNWELSAARSLEVVKFLEQAGISGQRLESRAFGPNRPVAPNDTEPNRNLNRRIEIRILPGS
ncbi:MAG: Flagellar motor protein MotB [Verrucomicrobia bacterium]|jgi:flagellar motor protein MotB|nr:MAG: Flagellar motor protein MotB [Verrucomicrobiota bacterium]